MKILILALCVLCAGCSTLTPEQKQAWLDENQFEWDMQEVVDDLQDGY